MATMTRKQKTAKTQERARRAVTEFRKLQPTLTAYARNLTGKRDVCVEMSVKSNGHTDGKKIFMKPPIALGDAAQMRHDRFLCDKRDPETLQQQCPACRNREFILAVIYHEIAHIAFDSFLPTTQTDADMTLKIIEAVFPAWYYKRLKDKFDRNPDVLYGKKDYAVLAHMVNPYFAFLVNALEDVRINERMADARPGTRVMQMALMLDAAINGVEQKDKTTGQTTWVHWSEYPTNHQAILAAMCIASGMKLAPEWFEERVYKDAQDAELIRLLAQIHKLSGPGAVYQACFPVYMRLRDLGYFQLTDEEPPPEPEEKPGDGENAEVQSSPKDGSDGEGDSSDPEADGGDGSGDSQDTDEGPDFNSPGEDGGDADDSGGSGSDADTPDTGGTAERGAGGPDDADAGDSGGGPSDGGADQDGADGSSEPGDNLGGSEDHRGDEPGRKGDRRDGEPDRGGDRGEQADDSSGTGGQGASATDQHVDGDRSEADGVDQADLAGTGPLDAEPGDHEGRGAEADSDGVEPDSGDQSPDGQDGVQSEPGDGEPDDLAEGVQPGSGGDRGADGSTEGDVSDPGTDADGSAEGADRTPADSGSEGSDGSQAGTEEPGLQSEDRDTEPGRANDLDAVDDRAIDDSDEVLDYKPDAESAVDFTDRELKHPPVPPTIGSDENLELIDLGVHIEVDEGDDAGEVMEKAVESAIIQSIYFEMPSSNIPGLKIWKYDNRHEDAVNRPWHAWEGDRYSDRSALRRGQVIDPVGEQYLGPALMRMRVVFSDNQRAKRNRNQRSGRIDTRTLGKRGWSGDDRLFGKKVLPGKKDYFVSIFLDISGSTVGVNIKMIKKAALAQAELCHRMGIKFAVYGHTGSWLDASEIYGDPWVDLYEIKAPEQPWDDKSRAALMELNPSMANLDGHTLEFARKLCDAQPQTNKVILYYSDGAMPLENHNEELEILQREIATCKAKGYTLLGVGVRTDSPSRHGLDTVQIDSSEEVNKVVTHLERYLVA